MEVEPERYCERDERCREHHNYACNQTRGVEVGALDTETVVDVDGLFIRNESEQQNAEQNRYHDEQGGEDIKQRVICCLFGVKDKYFICVAHHLQNILTPDFGSLFCFVYLIPAEVGEIEKHAHCKCKQRENEVLFHRVRDGEPESVLIFFLHLFHLISSLRSCRRCP